MVEFKLFLELINAAFKGGKLTIRVSLKILILLSSVS